MRLQGEGSYPHPLPPTPSYLEVDNCEEVAYAS